MKKIFIVVFACLLTLSLVACKDDNGNNGGFSSIVAAETWEIKSPDDSLNVTVIMDDYGSLYYTVKKDDVVVIEESALGFDLEEENLTEMLSVETVEENTINVSYDNISGKSSHVDATCNEVILKFKGYYFYMTLTMRAYDDGYAFKYGIEATDGSTGEAHVLEEKSEFALPDKSYTWIQAYQPLAPHKGTFFAYEEGYTKRKASNLYGKIVSMPMIYRAGTSDVYSLITESGLIGSGFYGSMLEVMEDESSTLQTIHTPAGIAENDNVITYPFVSPWRVGITGSLADVTESELVEKVYDDVEYWKPENYNTLSPAEQEIYDYEWVDPDITAWNWLVYTGNKPQNDFELQREYVDLAAEMGWKYTILDGGWNANFNANTFKSFMEYATSKGIKVIVWCNALNDFGNGNKAILESKLNTWASYGVAGIKIDFFDGQYATGQTHQGEDSETIKWYETIYQECAKRKMVVNCHGSNKPTGERRLYPNVINREGIKGNEMKGSVSGINNVNAMFTRVVVGPTDYTPVVYPLSNNFTVGHQMALSVLYESGTPSMADYTNTYRVTDIKQFFIDLPAVWDEMHYVAGELDGYFICARRSGDDWYVAGISAVETNNYSIDLSFLDEDLTYTGYLYEDGNDVQNRKDLKVSVLNSINSTANQSVKIEANGGFVLILKKN